NEGGSKEDEHVSAEIKRIPRKLVRTARDQRTLRFERDHTHVVPIKIERRPYAQEKSDRDEQPSRRGHGGGSKGTKPQNRIHDRAKVRQGKSDEHDAEIVKKAFEQSGH